MISLKNNGIGSKRLRKVVFEEDIERESPKNEKRMIKMLKKQLAVFMLLSLLFVDKTCC